MIGMTVLALLEIKEGEKVYGFGFFLYDILSRFNVICKEARKTGLCSKI